MPWTDERAAARIEEAREDLGLSQEGLANAIKLFAQERGWYKVIDGRAHGAVDAFTIRRIEKGHVPSPRVRVVIAVYLSSSTGKPVQPRDIWEPRNRRPVVKEAA